MNVEELVVGELVKLEVKSGDLNGNSFVGFDKAITVTSMFVLGGSGVSFDKYTVGEVLSKDMGHHVLKERINRRISTTRSLRKLTYNEIGT